MDNLVAGGAGFLGSHTISRLLKDGEKVICLDNFSTGKITNINSWVKHPNLKIIDHDILYPIDLRVDRIWHFACPASPKIYQKDPIKTAKINFIGTLNLLEIARNSNSQFLLASTSEIYGDSKEITQSECNNGILKTSSIRSCYREGKRIAETICFDYSRIYNINIHVARIFNTYGPNMSKNDGRVISNFINQALNNKNITIYGTGYQSRSFCYVDDLIDGLVRFVNCSNIGPINFGNPYEKISIKDLAKMIRLKTNLSLPFIYSPIPHDDPCMRQPNIEKAKSLLHWDPKIDLDKGLNKTINYFKKINV